MTAWRRQIGSLFGSNKLFVLLLGAGVVLRILVSLAYSPALMLQRDAYAYVNQAEGGSSGGFRPAVYPLLLKPLLVGHNVGVVAATQHLLGLGLAVGIYVLLRRKGVGPTVSALGTAPILLDPYQIDLEHYVLSETVFEALSFGAIAILLWKPIPSIANVVVCGAFLVLAGLTRYAGLVLILPALAYVVAIKAGGLKTVALVAVFALPLGVYSVVGPSISSGGPANRVGFFMFGRVLPFADCPTFNTASRLKHLLCSKKALSNVDRDHGYFKVKDQLGNLIHRTKANSTLLSFSLRAIAHQPIDYAESVGSDYARYFDLTGPQSEELLALKWRFVQSVHASDPLPYIARRGGAPPHELGFTQDFEIDRGLAAALAWYQRRIYTWGPLLGFLVLLGGAGAIFGRGDPRGTARVAGLMAGWAALILLFQVAVTVFHFRYTIPALPFAGAAGAAGTGALLHRLTRTQS